MEQAQVVSLPVIDGSFICMDDMFGAFVNLDPIVCDDKSLGDL